MISAQIEIAVSSGVRAPRSRPIGDISRSRSVGVDARLEQALQPLGVRRAAAHHADVADVGGQRGLHGRDVELVVVGQDADRVARPERRAAALEQRPGHDTTTSSAIGKRRRVAKISRASHDRDAVAEHLGDLGQRGREVDGAEDPHLRRRGVGLDEHPQDRRVLEVLRGRLALRPVVADARAGGLQLGERVAGDDAVEVGVAERCPAPARPGRSSSLAPRAGPSMTVARATGCSALMRSRSCS